MKKQLIILVATLVVGVGGYLVYDNFKLPADPDFSDLRDLGLPELDLYFSELGRMELPEVDFGTTFDVSTPQVGFSDIGIPDDFGVPEVSIEDPTFSLTSPQITPSMPQAPTTSPSEEEPPDTWEPNASDCSRFAMAPSCAYIENPEHRDMCEACKAAGF